MTAPWQRIVSKMCVVRLGRPPPQQRHTAAAAGHPPPPPPATAASAVPSWRRHCHHESVLMHWGVDSSSTGTKLPLSICALASWNC